MSADGYLPPGCTHDDVERDAPAGDDHERGDCCWCGERDGVVPVSDRDPRELAPVVRGARVCRGCARGAHRCSNPECRDLWRAEDLDEKNGLCLDCVVDVDREQLRRYEHASETAPTIAEARPAAACAA